jgi:hypothetical protein
MSEKQQFPSSAALNRENSIGQRSISEGRPKALKKRALLKHLVKKNTSCHHSQIYTQANVICRRISHSYEAGKISDTQAMALMFDAHEQMSHKGMPREVVAAEMHKRLDKLEGNNKASFAVIMANTNSSVHARGVKSKDEKLRTASNGSRTDRYSESYWADII